MDFATRTTTPSTKVPIRLASCIWRQVAKTPVCPETPRLDGKLALVTGGNAGLGLEIARGLAERGAEVVIAARNERTSAEACERIQSETRKPASYAPLDLSNLESVMRSLDRVGEIAAGRSFDLVVANAGVWPQQYEKSAQGHEMAFAVNTLGHFVLITRMLARGLLKAGRVVVLTGDIYIRSSECTRDFTYEGRSGGSMAYCRSKLGNIWFTRELQRRHAELEVVTVHPGVVATGLGGQAPLTGFRAKMRDLFILNPEAGAQTPLFCATQPNLERGGYYHNTLGRITLSPEDPAANDPKARELWERMEALSQDFPQ